MWGLWLYLAILFFVGSSLLFFFHFFLFVFFWMFSGEEIIIEFLFFYCSYSFFFHVIIDVYSTIFLSFIFLISIVVVFYRWFYIEGDLNMVRFIFIVLLFVGSIGLLVISPSILGIIFGWDGLGVTSFLLVIYYNNISSLRSGLVTIYINRVGDICLLFRFFCLISFGWFIDDIFIYFTFLVFSFFILIAGITKSAQIPFSSWLPAAISAPTPVSSLVHSSTLVTAGVYLFIRFFYLIGFYFLSFFFMLMRLLTSISAGIIACVESDIKKLVAMSTLSQLGILIFCISIRNVLFTFFHIVSHALFKSLLFLCCGLLILISLGNQDIRFLGNKFNSGKTIFLMLILSVFRLCGFPFLSGFFSKDFIIDYLVGERLILFFLLIFLLCCILSLGYSIKFLKFGTISYQIGFFSSYGFFNFLNEIFLLFLFFWSICLGNFLIFLMVDGEYYISFFFQKILGGFFFVLFIITLLNFFSKILFFNFNTFVFFCNILNVNWYFGGALSRKFKLFNFILQGETYWLEIIGAKGLNRWFNFLTNIISYNIKYFTISLGLFIFFLFGVFFLPFSL